MPGPRLAVVSFTSLLAACAVFPERPAPPAFPETAAFGAPLPEGYGTPPPDGPWWHRAVDTGIALELDRSLAANSALRAARSETLAARARLDQATADTGPGVSVGATAGIQKTSGTDAGDSATLGIDGELPLDASGALARREEAARYAWQASREDLVQLRSDLARDFLLSLVDAAEAGQRTALLDSQLEVARRLLRLIELRFSLGLASSLDVLQQRDQLAALRQQLPIALLDRERALNRLRLTANLSPDQPLGLPLDTLPEVQDRFVYDRPADLLDSVASLRAARARLSGADARFAAALADRWPTLTLSGGLVQRVASGDAVTLLAAALDAAFTLFDSGATLAIAAERRAQLAAAGERYLADWLAAALGADSLMRETASLEQRIDLSGQRLETAQALLEAAQRRYERGIIDYLPVLEALRGLQQQQRDHLALLAGLARSRVRLHHALGDPAREEAT